VPFAHKGYGASQQTGAAAGIHDSFTLRQTSTQNADQSSGQHNLVQGDCQSDGGSCQAGQQATLNGQDTADGYTAGTISHLIINCTNGHSTCSATPPPVPAITAASKPSNPTQSRDATFAWTDAATAGVTFKCSIDGLSFTACSSGGTGATFSSLGTGSHTFKVEAVDTTSSHNVSLPDSFTWTIVDANISLSPTSATNQAGTSHTVTCTIQQDIGDGNHFVAAPDATECDWSITAGPNNVQSGSCNTTGGAGTCTFNYSDTGGTGTDTIHATTTFSVSGVSMTRSTLTSGTDVHGDGLDVTKTWVDANISLSPFSATNTAGGSQTMTCTIQQDTGSGFVPAPDGTECDWSITAGPNSPASGFCDTSGGMGTCTFADSDTDAGTDTIHATTTFTVHTLSLTRSTLASGTDSSGDGTDASIEWDAAP
jgi:hypothetical protein